MANATSPLILSGSTQGMPIKVAATATPGTTIHTTGTGLSTTTVDRLYVWANNTQAAATATTVLLTLEYGDATAPDHNVQIPIPGQGGPVLVMDGFPLAGTGAAAATLKAFAATANVITLMGYVLRVTI